MQPPEPTRILLIDDHRMFNDGIKSLLDEQPDLTVCGQVFSATEALPAIHRTNPQLILLDTNLQGVSGIDLGRKILNDFANVRVLMLTMYNQPKLVEEARKAGLHGYLLKDATTSELLRGIRAVLSGQPYFDPHLSDPTPNPDNSFEEDDFARRFKLAFREVEVIRLIREGLTTEQIAERLFIAHETVKTHRKNIYFKLGISKVTELIQFAIRNGL